jgi:hypothetical protein
LSICVDVTPGVPLMCEKPLVAYTAIKEGQTVIASLIVETYAPGVSRPADAVGESQP